MSGHKITNSCIKLSLVVSKQTISQAWTLIYILVVGVRVQIYLAGALPPAPLISLKTKLSTGKVNLDLGVGVIWLVSVCGVANNNRVHSTRAARDFPRYLCSKVSLNTLSELRIYFNRNCECVAATWYDFLLTRRCFFWELK